nr:DUF6009 family protein [Streptomyces sp. DH7]
MTGCIELGADTEAAPGSGLYRRRVFFPLPATARDRARARDSGLEGVCRQGAPGDAAAPPGTVQPNRVGERTSRSYQVSSYGTAATGSWDREPGSLPRVRAPARGASRQATNRCGGGGGGEAVVFPVCRGRPSKS